MNTTILDIIPGTDGSLAKIVDGRVIGCSYWNLDTAEEILSYHNLTSGDMWSTNNYFTVDNSDTSLMMKNEYTSPTSGGHRFFKVSPYGIFGAAGGNSINASWHIDYNTVKVGGSHSSVETGAATGWYSTLYSNTAMKIGFQNSVSSGMFMFGSRSTGIFDTLSQNNFGLYHNCRITSTTPYDSEDPRWTGYPEWSKVYADEVATKFTLDCSSKSGYENMGGVFSASTHLYTEDGYTDFTDIKYGYHVFEDFFAVKRGVDIVSAVSGVTEGYQGSWLGQSDFVSSYLSVTGDGSNGMAIVLSTFGDMVFLLNGGISFDSSGMIGSGPFFTASGNGASFELVDRRGSIDHVLLNPMVKYVSAVNTLTDIDEYEIVISESSASRYSRTRTHLGKSTTISGDSVTKSNSTGLKYNRGRSTITYNLGYGEIYENDFCEHLFWRYARSVSNVHNLAYHGLVSSGAVDELQNGHPGEFSIMGVVHLGAKSGTVHSHSYNTFIAAHEEGFIIMDSQSSLKVMAGDDHLVASRKWVKNNLPTAYSFNHADLYGVDTFNAGSDDTTHNGMHITSGAGAVIFGGGVSEGAYNHSFTQSFVKHGKTGDTISNSGGIERSYPGSPGEIPYGVHKEISGVDNLAIEWESFYGVFRKSFKSKSFVATAVTGTATTSGTINLGGFYGYEDSDNSVSGIVVSGMVDILSTVSGGKIRFSVTRSVEASPGETYNIIICNKSSYDVTVTVDGSFSKTWTGDFVVKGNNKYVVISGVYYSSPANGGSDLILTKTETV